MATTIRSEITIPDHEVLRKIGGGAYGEVWMARGVTGALRAVKVVWREDFEDERGFEREFEGILKFEPISRDHPGLVNILHVGRSTDEENSFYYYVMELGDDINAGEESNPVEYEARTLLSDLKASKGKPLDLNACVDAGQRLAEALQHLHDKDLAHRDVKPANVIFVGGKAKLADIGLVAARGQQTFVGTEGFVPPEGPGSGQADIYSLGKVLYEMATGKDRLQFPELPDEIPEGSNRKNWVALNEVICNICDPKLSKRTINTAQRLAESLAAIKQGKKVKTSSKGSKVKAVLALMIIGGMSYSAIHYKPWKAGEAVVSGKSRNVEAVVDNSKKEYQFDVCSVQFISTPVHAEILGHEKNFYLETTTEYLQYAPGTVLNLEFKREGYRPYYLKYVVPDKEIEWVQVTLDTFLPPKPNQRWADSLGARYEAKDGYHESGFVIERHFNEFLNTKPKVDPYVIEKFNEQGRKKSIVMMTPNTAKKFVDWLEKDAKAQGLLEENFCIVFKQDNKLMVGPKAKWENRIAKQQFATKCIAKAIPYASLKLTSNPSGARVYINNAWVGVTPMTHPELRPGKLKLEFSLDGYKANVRNLKLTENEEQSLSVKLSRNNGVVFDRKWVNSQKVGMMPFDKGKLAAVWEVRVKDYNEFRKAMKYRATVSPGFPQNSNHPVVGVSKSDAVAFCKWLTKKERKEDRIQGRHEYRIPTDVEWSLFCGIGEERGANPGQKYYYASQNRALSNMYPWGDKFPPQRRVANLADKDAAKAAGVPMRRVIAKYQDSYTNTAPVGSYIPNKLGMFDVSGNVFEWVTDSYNQDNKLGTVRGGSWASFQKKDLKSWSRFPINKEVRDNQYGFRVILVDTSAGDSSDVADGDR